MLETFQMPLAPLALAALHWLFIIPICLLSIFLTLLILVQRGRGGGLTGALGGMGGQSAFGTKAGDVFTKITVVVAMLWILLSMGALRVLHQSKLSGTSPNATKTDLPGNTKTPAGGTDPTDTKPGAGLTPENTPTPTTTPPATPEVPSSTPPATPETPAPSTPVPATPAPATPAPETPKTPEPAPEATPKADSDQK